MSILVSDTSVLIDLERADRLEELFLLPFGFVVPDLLFARELAGDLGDRLVRRGLRIEELTPEELRRATIISRQHKRLSTPDAFALAVASSRGWGLLTGDGTLRDLANAEQIMMHGVLWVFDQLEDGNYIDMARLRDGLTKLSAHPRCRLPAQEVRLRIASFARR